MPKWKCNLAWYLRCVLNAERFEISFKNKKQKKCYLHLRSLPLFRKVIAPEADALRADVLESTTAVSTAARNPNDCEFPFLSHQGASQN